MRNFEAPAISTEKGISRREETKEKFATVYLDEAPVYHPSHDKWYIASVLMEECVVPIKIPVDEEGEGGYGTYRYEKRIRVRFLPSGKKGTGAALPSYSLPMETRTLIEELTSINFPTERDTAGRLQKLRNQWKDEVWRKTEFPPDPGRYPASARKIWYADRRRRFKKSLSETKANKPSWSDAEEFLKQEFNDKQKAIFMRIVNLADTKVGEDVEGSWGQPDRSFSHEKL